MFGWFQNWKKRRAVKQLVRQMGTLLRQRYGFQEYYSPDQVRKTADIAGLDEERQAGAIAIYVQPQDAIRILTALRDAKWANELRKFMIVQCFGFSGGNDGSSDYNVFMHHEDVSSHHAINSTGGDFGGSHGHHFSDGGHSHGGDSGGHSGGDSGGY